VAQSSQYFATVSVAKKAGELALADFFEKHVTQEGGEHRRVQAEAAPNRRRLQFHIGGFKLLVNEQRRLSSATLANEATTSARRGWESCKD
jgi:hypothetical protein